MKFSNPRFRGAFTLLQFVLTLAIVCLMAALAIPVRAVDLYQNQEVRQFTNSVTAIAGSAATNLNVSLPLRQGKNHIVLFKFAASGSDTDPVVFYLYPKPDGTNAATTQPLVLSVAANGTTAQVGWTNLHPLIWDGSKEVVLKTVSNAHASAVIYLTNTFLINNK